ncbi:hypothetical protein Tco_0643503, partial [Tanacetum coccineum]
PKLLIRAIGLSWGVVGLPAWQFNSWESLWRGREWFVHGGIGLQGKRVEGRLRCKGVTKQIIGVVPKGLALRVVLVDLHSKDESGKGFKLENYLKEQTLYKLKVKIHLVRDPTSGIRACVETLNKKNSITITMGCIFNGDLEEEHAPTRETSAPPAPETAKQLVAKRNQERVKSILLLAILDEYLLKFYNVADAKSTLEHSKIKFGGKEDPRSAEKCSNKNISLKTFLQTASNEQIVDKANERYLNDLYNNLRVYEYEMKRSLSSTSTSQKLAFLSSENTSSTNKVSTANRDFGVSTAGGISQVSSTPCAHDVASGKNQGKRSYGDNGRSNAPINKSSSQAFVAQDGLDEYAIRKKIIESKTTDLNTKTSETVGKTNEANTQKPKTVYESVNRDKVIIEDWNSDDEDDVSEVQTVSPVKTNETQIGNLEILLQDHAVVDSSCSSHMTGNKAYLSDYEDYNRGFVAFGSDPKGDELKFNLFSISQMCDKKNSVLFTETECLILSPSFKLLDESQVVLRAPRKDAGVPVCLENQLNHNVKIIRCDNGIEFKNHAMNEFCAKKDKGPTRIILLSTTTVKVTRIPIEDVVPASHEKPSKSSPKDNDTQDSEDIADKEGQHQMTEDEKVLHDELEKDDSQESQATSINKLNTVRSSVSTATTPYVSAASTPIGANDGESSFVYLGVKIPIDASTLPNVDLP